MDIIVLYNTKYGIVFMDCYITWIMLINVSYFVDNSSVFYVFSLVFHIFRYITNKFFS